ncbi:biopolymer transporter ExbD [Selenomonadales bacterium OttesenSCG-928-I06]|nr:biopolymer transporter ExbD [Selenomonadales bacterium OttesenSCG-928-I06]
MKLSNLRNERKPKLMIIPMIDIIFFLLVFFMLSTLYMVEQRSISLNLPQTATYEIEMGTNVNISVLANGNIVFGNEEIPLNLLKNKALIESQNNKETVFVLNADENIPYKTVVAVLDELRSAKVNKIALATRKKGD